jgi:hypothetical protein
VACGITAEVVSKAEGQKGLGPLPRSWAVERTLGIGPSVGGEPDGSPPAERGRCGNARLAIAMANFPAYP